MEGNAKKKIAIVSVCSVLLVAMVVSLVVVTVRNDQNKKDNTNQSSGVASSSKAIQSLCQNTDYQNACVDSLSKSNTGKDTSDPKELIELYFQASMKEIQNAIKNSSVIKEIQADPRGISALKDCEELANRAVNDLQRSFTKFKGFDISDVSYTLEDLKTWLSGAITYQETCLEGFEGIQGNPGEKMRLVLKKAMEMTSNGLAMVTGLSSVIENAAGDDQMAPVSSRRLLSDENINVVRHGRHEFPEWVDSNRRKLLTTAKIRPDIVVAKDGSGKFKTINEALKFVPTNGKKTFILYIKEGVYNEKVQISSNQPFLMMVGDGPTKTKITGNLNFIDGTSTFHTATVAVQGDHFMAKDIGFENSAGAAKHQAVALRVSSDMAIFYNCQMDGYQDTLYAHTYRQFYRDCTISGTIDFIFGDSAAVFQGCTLIVRKPLDNQNCIVTAQGRKDIRQPTGLVLQNCTFKADPKYLPVANKNKAYLGRPWKEFSRTIIMESFLDEFLQPDGWLPWNETFALKTLFYVEFNNRGPASPKQNRVKWDGIKELPAERVKRFTAGEFLDGDRWVKKTEVPYASGFLFPVPKKDPNVDYSPESAGEKKDLGGGSGKDHKKDKKDKKEEDKEGKSDKSKNNNAPVPVLAAPSPSEDSVPQLAPASASASEPWMQFFSTPASAPAPAPEANAYGAPAPAPEPNSYGAAGPSLSPNSDPEYSMFDLRNLF